MLYLGSRDAQGSVGDSLTQYSMVARAREPTERAQTRRLGPANKPNERARWPALLGELGSGGWACGDVQWVLWIGQP